MKNGVRQPKRDWKHKLVRGVLCFCVFILVSVLLFSFFVPPESWKYYVSTPKVGKRKAGELRIHFIDVGQGDSTLIELPDGKVMLIDGGEEDAKKNLLRYLNALEIEKIDYLLVTHTDGDHCGSLEEVFRYKKVVNAYMPLTFENTATEYAQTYEAAVREKCKIFPPTRAVDLSSQTGNYTLRFLYPYEEEHLGEGARTEEDPSAVVWLDYMGTSALFGGDMSGEVERWLVSMDGLGLLPENVALSSTEILKVAHHGSGSSTCSELLEYIHAKMAVISCGKDNPYKHPSGSTLERLAAYGVESYRTDMQGHILLTVAPTGEYRLRAVKK